MAVDRIDFELVSPEKILVSKPVTMVTLPAGEGDMGVLPGHAPMIVTVRPGVVEVQDDKIERLFVAGGFAEVTPDRCAILATEAMPVASLSRAAADAEIKKSEEEISFAKDDVTREIWSARLSVAQAKRDAAVA